MKISDILRHKGSTVVTIGPGDAVTDLLARLAEHNIGAIVVVDRDAVVGIVSERDIVRALADQGAEALTKPLSHVMTRKVTTCTEADTVGMIMEQMTSGKFRHVPVVEEDALVGIISIGDVVKHRLWEMEQESAALRDYIQTA